MPRQLFIGLPSLQRSKNSKWVCVLIEFEWQGEGLVPLEERRHYRKGEGAAGREKVLPSSRLEILGFREIEISNFREIHKLLTYLFVFILEIILRLC